MQALSSKLEKWKIFKFHVSSKGYFISFFMAWLNMRLQFLVESENQLKVLNDQNFWLALIIGIQPSPKYIQEIFL